MAEEAHIVGFHVYFDEKRIRPILKQPAINLSIGKSKNFQKPTE